MPIRREFLGFEKPALTAAAEWLLDRHARDGAADLTRVLVVVPGSGARRRLLEVLLAQSEARGAILHPPDVVTAGKVPERLYQAKKPFADELTQQLTWVRALREIEPRVRAALIPRPPEHGDLDAWVALAELLLRLHRELAAEDLDFETVRKRAAKVAGFDEEARWRALVELQERYHAALDAANLWDQQTARLYAIRNQECRLDGEIVLLGTVDMNRALRHMIDQVADRASALVFAPAAWADRFDEHGCLDPEAWQSIPLAVRTEQIRLADDPVDQANAAARAIAEFDGRYAAAEIVVGVPDQRLVPQLERQFSECGIAVRWGVGRELSASAPYRLLAAVADYLAGNRFADFAALVRHPDLEAWLSSRGIAGDLLTALDRYYTEHLPSRVSARWLGKAEEIEQIAAAHGTIDGALSRLTSARRRPGEWCEPLLGFLRDVYAQREFARDDPADVLTITALEKIRDAAGQLASIPVAMTPDLNAAEAIRWLLSQVARRTVAAPAADDAIELLGWLELPWDDSPALVLTSFNEGYVPEPTPADPFLPNRLRSLLGLWDNARRYARDAYYLDVLARTRRDLTMIVARRDADGNPLSPSRLLFAADEATVVRRAGLLFDDQSRPGPRRPLAGVPQAARRRSGFVISRPVPVAEPPMAISVTALRDYIACPFRFYLRHVLRLRASDDRAEELDAGAFGSLLHDVLARFGREELAASSDAEKIEAFLFDALSDSVRRSFGRQPLPPLVVQVAQLRARLAAFARWQADWAAQGWRIFHSEEVDAELKAEFLVDSLPIALVGRIDRIDVRADTGEFMILDYKSSAKADGPEKKHRKSGEWVDLQLPLYRHFAQCLKIDGLARLGYVTVPKDISRVGLVEAAWSEEELAEADEVARGVIRRIRRGEFWPPQATGAGAFDELADICQETVFDPQREEAEAPAAPPAAQGGAGGSRKGVPPSKRRSHSREAAP